jgi:hypothetical protein
VVKAGPALSGRFRRAAKMTINLFMKMIGIEIKEGGDKLE